MEKRQVRVRQFTRGRAAAHPQGSNPHGPSASPPGVSPPNVSPSGAASGRDRSEAATDSVAEKLTTTASSSAPLSGIEPSTDWWRLTHAALAALGSAALASTQRVVHRAVFLGWYAADTRLLGSWLTVRHYLVCWTVYFALSICVQAVLVHALNRLLPIDYPLLLGDGGLDAIAVLARNRTRDLPVATNVPEVDADPEEDTDYCQLLTFITTFCWIDSSIAIWLFKSSPYQSTSFVTLGFHDFAISSTAKWLSLRLNLAFRGGRSFPPPRLLAALQVVGAFLVLGAIAVAHYRRATRPYKTGSLARTCRLVAAQHFLQHFLWDLKQRL
ncbi:putative transmembrane protein [Gregarina niphandrodes]|uniref:Transmembrane protein n=1 Tax=Gregarina niphandrodes TaxID=110365 RepID=A0A023B3U1_GRENI|nr:putative transmembrane protein [Gregarina niphandrodes]EZG55944.1 putative transmembrane protein [Gregarina niphandrodes]|eukprot:XP_011131401.1 putative transmembrane protein [Gregarina niphandrodes]